MERAQLRSQRIPGFPVLLAFSVVLTLGAHPVTGQEELDEPLPPERVPLQDGEPELVHRKSSFGTSGSKVNVLRRQYETLRDSPDAPPEWQEMIRLGRELREQYRRKGRAYDPVRARMDELAKNPAVAQWKEKVEAVEKAFESLERERVEQGAIEARKLFEARHTALAPGVPVATDKARALGFDVLSFPRVDGSTSTQPLAVLMACRCLDAPYGWKAVREHLHWGRAVKYDDVRYLTGLDWEPEFKLAEYSIQARTDDPARERKAVIINQLLATNSSTHQSYVNLIEGRSDLGLLARGPSQDELELARTKKVGLDVVPFALDAFVFLVNAECPVRDLTHEQIRGIYSGRITNWNGVGGPDAPITAYQRDRNSGSQELMRELVMKGLAFAASEENESTPRYVVVTSMGGPYVELTMNRGGLAYSVHYYEQYMAASALTCSIAVNGVVPTFKTIQARKYPYTTEVYAVVRKGLDGASAAIRLRDWLLSSEGQAVVRESGYVPISPVVAPK